MSDNEQRQLPFTVPTKVPRWVCGFPQFLKLELGIEDENLVIMHDTWLKYETMYWKHYRQSAKPRKQNQRPKNE